MSEERYRYLRALHPNYRFFNGKNEITNEKVYKKTDLPSFYIDEKVPIDSIIKRLRDVKVKYPQFDKLDVEFFVRRNEDDTIEIEVTPLGFMLESEKEKRERVLRLEEENELHDLITWKQEQDRIDDERQRYLVLKAKYENDDMVYERQPLLSQEYIRPEEELMERGVQRL